MLLAMQRGLACLATAVAIAVGLAPAGSSAPAARRCQPTQGEVAGPFERGGLTAPRRGKIGTGHLLQGRILRAPDCAPVSGALVVLWQAGPSGYDARGRGSVRSDRSGRFRFQGPVPASYTGRQPHIHIAVSHPGYEELLTRYVVRQGATTGRITLVLTPLL